MATIRVLIVDDEEDIRDLLARLVRREGYEPLVAGDGEQALWHIAAAAPDVVLLDVKMPSLSGLHVLHETKRLRPAVPVIMITSQSRLSDVHAALHAGASDYVIKPFDHADVVRALQRAVAARIGTG